MFRQEKTITNWLISFEKFSFSRKKFVWKKDLHKLMFVAEFPQRDQPIIVLDISGYRKFLIY